MAAMTAKGVSSLLTKGTAGVHAAGGGLYLKISGKNTGSWLFRYMLDGKAKKMGLGACSAVSLAEARTLAGEQLALLARGIDPQAAKAQTMIEQEKEIITFDVVAADYIEMHRDKWTNKKHAQQWKNTLDQYASPTIGHLKPCDITTEHILEVLKPIWESKHETATRVRNRIEVILNAAKVRKLRDGENVAAWRGHLELLLPKLTGQKRKHHAALSWRDIGAFWQAIASHSDTSAQALKLTILTGVRTKEAIGAKWSEIDFDNALWTIPAERMKAKKEHRIPLSKTALDLLERIPKEENSPYLFTGQSGIKPISNMAMLMKCRGLDENKYKADGIGWRDAQGEVITVHGFRSTFRDWAAENTSFANIVVEQALAHTIGNAVEAAYRRGDLLEKRRDLMQAWANHVTKQPAENILYLNKRA